MNINNVSTTELEDELARRKRKSRRPTEIKNPDFSEVKKLCRDYIDSMFNGKYIDEDADHVVFEAALRAMFGNGVFSKIDEYYS